MARSTSSSVAPVEEWYVMVGRHAVCAFHGPPHLHAHSDQAHPDHHQRVPIDPTLSLAETLRRIRPLCESLPREPTLAELAESLR